MDETRGLVDYSEVSFVSVIFNFENLQAELSLKFGRKLDTESQSRQNHLLQPCCCLREEKDS